MVLLVDVGLLRHKEPQQRASLVGSLTALGLVGVLALLGQHLAVTGDLYFMDRDRILVVDRLAITLRIVIVVLALGATLFSLRYRFTKHFGEYFALLLFATVGLNLLVATENLLMFFVALELLSICLYALTGMHRGVLRSGEGAVKYFMVGALSSAFLLFGLSWIVGSTGAVELNALREALRSGSSPLRLTGLVFVVVGLGFKLAAVPFHSWAPDAYQGAPTPVTAFIATASKVASFVVGAKILMVGFGGMAGAAHWPWRDMSSGIISTARVEPGWVMLLALLAAASMLWGNLAALTQKNVKRMLAYSSIAHAGYVFVGIAAFVQQPTGGAVQAISYYLLGYTAMTLGAFGVVLAFERRDDRRLDLPMDRLAGTGLKYPALGLAMTVFMLSLAGVPPTAGFFGKLSLFAAAVEAGRVAVVVVAVLASVAGAFYYLRVLVVMYMKQPATTESRIDSPWLWAGLWACAAVTVVAGVLPESYFAFAKKVLAGWMGS